MITTDEIKSILASLGGRQAALATEVGVTQPTVSRWLNGAMPDDVFACARALPFAEGWNGCSFNCRRTSLFLASGRTKTLYYQRLDRVDETHLLPDPEGRERRRIRRRFSQEGRRNIPPVQGRQPAQEERQGVGRRSSLAGLDLANTPRRCQHSARSRKSRNRIGCE